MAEVRNEVPDLLFVAGIVFAHNVTIAEAPAGLAAELERVVSERSAQEFSPIIKESVRQLLKRGGFKPTGRNKPASEYLAQAAREGRFPRINNLVDINNLLSLEIGLPISLLDLDTFYGSAVLRYGRTGEKYIFNNAGQEIDLEGLICICSENGTPLGNAVKDSMTGKLKPHTKSVIGVIYGSKDIEAGQKMATNTERFADLLKRYAGASDVSTLVLGEAH